jgi:nucleotide-binding universal stress UspA family protein
MINLYSPQTGEHIRTETPADWMGKTDTSPPDYDAATQSAFWRGDHWEIVQGGPSQEELLTQAKNLRAAEVAAIVVTTSSGKTFDGHEEAQNRMSRALTAMGDDDVLPWVLADNTLAEVGRDELREALRQAGAAMAEIWVKPYLQP